LNGAIGPAKRTAIAVAIAVNQGRKQQMDATRAKPHYSGPEVVGVHVMNESCKRWIGRSIPPQFFFLCKKRSAYFTS
jgi:hypothetical protein